LCFFLPLPSSAVVSVEGAGAAASVVGVCGDAWPGWVSVGAGSAVGAGAAVVVSGVAGLVWAIAAAETVIRAVAAIIRRTMVALLSLGPIRLGLIRNDSARRGGVGLW